MAPSGSQLPGPGEDFLPAVQEPIDTSLKTTPLEFRRLLIEEQRKSYQISKESAHSRSGHTDIRDNRIALFARFVPQRCGDTPTSRRRLPPGRFKPCLRPAWSSTSRRSGDATIAASSSVSAEEPSLRSRRPVQDRDPAAEDKRQRRCRSDCGARLRQIRVIVN